jgi:hypothetical protein
MTRESMDTAESTPEIPHECCELTLDELHHVSGGAAFPPNPCVRPFQAAPVVAQRTARSSLSVDRGGAWSLAGAANR